jgi:hypothetical protein
MAASRVSANRARPLNEPGLFKDFLILREWSSLAFWQKCSIERLIDPAQGALAPQFAIWDHWRLNQR